MHTFSDTQRFNAMCCFTLLFTLLVNHTQPSLQQFFLDSSIPISFYMIHPPTLFFFLQFLLFVMLFLFCVRQLLVLQYFKLSFYSLIDFFFCSPFSYCCSLLQLIVQSFRQSSFAEMFEINLIMYILQLSYSHMFIASIVLLLLDTFGLFSNKTCESWTSIVVDLKVIPFHRPYSKYFSNLFIILVIIIYYFVVCYKIKGTLIKTFRVQHIKLFFVFTI